MKTTFILYQEKYDEVLVESDIEFNTAVEICMKKVPITAFDNFYQIESIVSIDLTENIIELNCTEI
jgi:hypothetical protein